MRLHLRPVCFFFLNLSILTTDVTAWWQLSVQFLIEPDARAQQIRGRPHLREITDIKRCQYQPSSRGINPHPIDVEAIVVFNSPFNTPEVQVLMFYKTGPCNIEPYIVVKLNDLPNGLQAISFRALGIRERPASYKGFRYTDPEVQPYLTELRGGQNGVWYLNNPTGEFVWLDVVDIVPSTAVDAAVAAAEYHDAGLMSGAMLRGYSVYRDQIDEQPQRVPISDPFIGDQREEDQFELMATGFQSALAANQQTAWREKYNRLNNIAGYIFNSWAQLTAGGTGLYMGDTGIDGGHNIQPNVIDPEEQGSEESEERLYKEESKLEQDPDLASDGVLYPQIVVNADNSDTLKREDDLVDYQNAEAQALYPAQVQIKEEIIVNDEGGPEQEANAVREVKVETYKIEKEEYTDEYDPYEDEYEEVDENQDLYEDEADASPIISPGIVDRFFNTELNQLSDWQVPLNFDGDQIAAEIEQEMENGKKASPIRGIDANLLVNAVMDEIEPGRRIRGGRRARRRPAPTIAPPPVDDNKSVAAYDFGESALADLNSPSVGGPYESPAGNNKERVDDLGEGLDTGSDYEPAVGKNRKVT
ncbi:hypothetical protein Dda_1039 [Drechslerella dactyloides]|uniref:Uncharacterized protein n=1 Tax=Drechslerella dactyloides TaxID=74499 RepID=A0AAD6J8H7_DREDA|nr:hypothetical protein Dda_1039 [Drechslerella dactyloides]